MPIEFRCTECRKLLRTQDGTAGKQARCPVCGTLVPIPDVMSPPPLPASTAPPPARLAADASLPASSPPAASAVIIAPRLDIIGVQLTAWRIFRRNLRLCIAVTLVAAIVYFAVWSIVITFPHWPYIGSGVVSFSTNMPAVRWLAEIFVYSLLLAGQAVFFLKLVRGQPANLLDFFSGWRWALNAFLAYLLAHLAFVIGLVFLIVPGVIVAIMLSQAIYLVVDRNAGFGDALQMSRRLTHGHRFELFGLLVIVAFFAIAVALFTCGLALVALLPWIGILRAVVYLKLSGQPIADAAEA
jgi:uncharacterized membrane protein